MDYRDVSIKIDTTGSRLPSTPIERLKQTISQLNGRKYSHVTLKAETDTNISLINTKIKTRIVNQQQAINLKPGRYLPLKVEDRAGGGVKVTYVKVNELTRKIGLNKEAANNLINLSINQSTNLNHVTQQVQNVSEISAYQLAVGLHAANTLKDKLNERINPDLRQQMDSYVKNLPSVSVKDIEKLPTASSEDFVSQRVSGSNSISSSGDSPMLSNWKKADSYVKDLAYNKKPLTLDAFCNINKILLENIPRDEEDSSPPGEIRENPVLRGGGTFLCFSSICK